MINNFVSDDKQNFTVTNIFIQWDEYDLDMEARKLAAMLENGNYANKTVAVCPECGDAVIDLGDGDFVCKRVSGGSCTFRLSFEWSEALMLDPARILARMIAGDIAMFHRPNDRDNSLSDFLNIVLIYDESRGWGMQVIEGSGRNPISEETGYVIDLRLIHTLS